MALKEQLNGGPTDWFIRAAIVAVMAWSLNEISQMRDDISRIQENRFTDSDGDDLATAVSDLRARMETKADKSDVPPAEVLRDIERLENSIERLRSFHEK